jgi:hypothetical protein
MTDDRLTQGKTDFEPQDLSAKAVLSFLAGLGIVCVLMYLVLWGVYGFLNHYQKAHQPPQNPLVQATNRDTRLPRPAETDKFPEPRLETSEGAQLNDQRVQEEETLNTYGWLNRKEGVAHIPIKRAMALIVERGLPVAPQEPAAEPTKDHLPAASRRPQPGATASR